MKTQADLEVSHPLKGKKRLSFLIKPIMKV